MVADFSQLSILIPTMNRPLYLKHALKYYNEFGFNGHIYIGDSSINEDTKTICKEYNNVVYYYLPKQEFPSAGSVTNYLAGVTPTKYVIISGDDDFIILPTIERSIKFLDENPGYGACGGNEVSGEFINGKLNISNSTFSGDFDTDDPIKRMMTVFFVGGACLHYVQRSEVLINAIETLENGFTEWIGDELLHAVVTVVRNKCKNLPGRIGFYYFRNPSQVYKNKGSFNFFLMNFICEDPRFQYTIKRFREITVNELVGQGINKKEAEHWFNLGISYRISSTLSNNIQNNPDIVKMFSEYIDNYNGIYSKFINSATEQDMMCLQKACGACIDTQKSLEAIIG